MTDERLRERLTAANRGSDRAAPGRRTHHGVTFTEVDERRIELAERLVELSGLAQPHAFLTAPIFATSASSAAP